MTSIYGFSFAMGKSAWSSLIASYLKAGRLPHQESEKIIGRLSFSSAILFGKFAMTKIRLLYAMQFRAVYNSRLSAEGRKITHRWRETVSSFSPRVCAARSGRFDWFVYTEAASNPPRICALLFDSKKHGIHLDTQAVAFPRAWGRLFKETSAICGLELLALVAFFGEYGPSLPDSSIWDYVDNDNCRSAVTRGDSNAEVIAVLSGRQWASLQRYNICIGFPRVPAKLSPAEWPARAKRIPFRPRRRRRFNAPAYFPAGLKPTSARLPSSFGFYS